MDVDNKTFSVKFESWLQEKLDTIRQEARVKFSNWEPDFSDDEALDIKKHIPLSSSVLFTRDDVILPNETMTTQINKRGDYESGGDYYKFTFEDEDDFGFGDRNSGRRRSAREQVAQILSETELKNTEKNTFDDELEKSDYNENLPSTRLFKEYGERYYDTWSLEDEIDAELARGLPREDGDGRPNSRDYQESAGDVVNFQQDDVQDQKTVEYVKANGKSKMVQKGRSYLPMDMLEMDMEEEEVFEDHQDLSQGLDILNNTYDGDTSPIITVDQEDLRNKWSQRIRAHKLKIAVGVVSVVVAALLFVLIGFLVMKVI